MGSKLLGHAFRCEGSFCRNFADLEIKQTVKDNILFGKDMDRSWYKEVIKA